MALSNRILSGCFEPTPASGLTDFLLVQAAVTRSSVPSNAINSFRPDKLDCDKPDIRPQTFGLREKFCVKLRVASRNLYFLQGGLRCRSQKLLRIPSWITIAEHGVARHQNFGSGTDHVDYGLRRHSAIDFDAIRQAALVANLG